MSLRGRKDLIFAGLAALAGAALALTSLAERPPSVGARDITLLYVGAEDCAPCRTWQRDDGAAFRSTTEFARIRYREVKSPALFGILKDEYWPEDLRNYRDRIKRGAGVPLWLLVSDGQIIEQRFGAAQWQATVLPRIKSLLR